MASVDSKILQADYNSIRSKVVAVLGSGTADSGYGQTLQSSAVTNSSRVTINEYSNLRYDLFNAYKHIFGTFPPASQPQIGNTVRVSSLGITVSEFDISEFNIAEYNLVTIGLAESPYPQYDLLANQIVSNRFTIAPGESGTTATVSSSRTTSWVSECTCLITFNWSNAAQARYWFNSGGRIRISASRAGGANTAQNSNWTQILNAAGTINFGGAFPSANTTPNDGTNWYRTTSTFAPYSTISGTTAYTANRYLLEARCVGVASNSAGTAAQGEIRVRFRDLYTDPGPPLPNDVVDGTLTVSVSTLFAAATTLVPGSGVFTVEQPVIAVGAVIGS